MLPLADNAFVENERNRDGGGDGGGGGDSDSSSGVPLENDNKDIEELQKSLMQPSRGETAG